MSKSNGGADLRRWQQLRAERDDHPADDTHDLFSTLTRDADAMGVPTKSPAVRSVLRSGFAQHFAK